MKGCGFNIFPFLLQILFIVLHNSSGKWKIECLNFGKLAFFNMKTQANCYYLNVGVEFQGGFTYMTICSVGGVVGLI